MSLTSRIPTKIKGDEKNPLVQDMLEVIEDNQNAYRTRAQTLKKLKQLRKDLLDIKTPQGNDWTSSLQPLQIIDQVWRNLKRPSATYWSDTASPEATQIVRDAVKTVQEMGGYTDVLNNKPSQFFEALAYGDGFMRIGIDETSKYKITYDNVLPDTVYADSNASVMHTQNSTRAVTRIVVIYTYDFDNAKQLYPDVKFGLGEIPRMRRTTKDFNKTFEQESQSKKREVEIAHYFDIGGKEPVYLVVAGEKTKILEKKVGDKYSWRDKYGKPKMPIGQMRGATDMDEGLFNAGYLLIFYKYIIARQELMNKRFGQNIRALTDIKILNASSMKAGTVLKRIRDAKRMSANGEQGLILNDSRDPISIEQIEKNQAGDNALQNLEASFDQEIKRMGINLDAIRESQSTTATQIIQENSVEQGVAQQFINRNTQYFKFVEEMTMNLIREFIEPDDDTPIRTTVKESTKDSQGEIQDKEMKGVTLGDVKQLLDKHTFFVEIDTKSGVREKQTTRLARALALGQVSGGDPTIARFIAEEFAAANNTKLPDIQQPQQGGGISQQGISAATKQLTQPAIGNA